jgi:hypothetical protein
VHENRQTVTYGEMTVSKLYLIGERLLKHSPNQGENHATKNHLQETNIIINNYYLKNTNDCMLWMRQKKKSYNCKYGK